MAGISLNSNITSLNAQRRLSDVTKGLTQNFNRLSSGLRINKSSDDAAGLAISENLKTDARLSNQALRNVNDGISMISIITGALDSQKQVLFRMAELAEQSANGVNGKSQREAMQQEYMSLLDEFDRIATSAKFNGVSLLRNPEGEQINLMAGITGADVSLLRVAGANSHRFAGVFSQRSNVSLDQTRINSSDTFFLRLVPELHLSGGEPFTDALKSIEMMDSAIVEFTDSTGMKGQLAFLVARVRGDQYGTSGSIPNPFPYAYSRQEIFLYAIRSDGEKYSDSNISLSPDGSPILTSIEINATFAISNASFSISLDLSDLTFEPFENVKDQARPTAIGFTNINNFYSAKRALPVIRNRIEDLSIIQGEFGAIESRLAVTANQLTISRENFASAASQITDVDVATESANLTANQIMQRAASSVLAQANQQPSLVLGLLSNV